jgi:hypothetical protein
VRREYPWLSGEGQSVLDPAIGAAAGVYAFAFDAPDGFVVYVVGETARSFAVRLREHTTAYLAGTYTLIDPDAAAAGQRVELWRGLWFMRDAWKRLPELLARGDRHFAEVERVLRAYRVFLLPIEGNKRLGERIEATLAEALYSDRNPYAAIPDRGMALRPRRRGETPITLRLKSQCRLVGVPSELNV